VKWRFLLSPSSVGGRERREGADPAGLLLRLDRLELQQGGGRCLRRRQRFQIDLDLPLLLLNDDDRVTCCRLQRLRGSQRRRLEVAPSGGGREVGIKPFPAAGGIRR